MKILKFVIIILVSIILLDSCSMERYCSRRFPPEVSTDTIQNTVTIIKHDTVYRDTIIPVTIPGAVVTDTVQLPDTIIWSSNGVGVYISNKKLRSLNARAFTPLAEAEAHMQIKPLRIVLNLTQKDTTLKIKLDSALMRVDFWKEKYLEIQNNQVKVEKYIPGFYKFTLWWFIGTLFLFLLYLAIKR